MRYHLRSKAVGWIGEVLEMRWCVEDEAGNRLTVWQSRHGAESDLGKLLSAQRRGEV